MYVLARHTGESLELLDGLIEVKVLSITGKIVRLGINAPREVSVKRKDPVAPEEIKHVPRED